MLKALFTFLFAAAICAGSKAQQNDSVKVSVYYFKYPQQHIDNKDSADYTRVIMPPDSINRDLYTVTEYYPTGILKFAGKSSNNDVNLLLQGQCVEYFPNGKKKQIKTFEKGLAQGHFFSYYPNGKFYNDKLLSDNKLTFDLLLCKDSTGNTLTEKGNGTWIEYSEDFTAEVAKGQVKNGKKDGEWTGWDNDSIRTVQIYLNGELLSSNSFDKQGKKYIPTASTNGFTLPTYKGGLASLNSLLRSWISYPPQALKNKIQGKVTVTFMVEESGSLSNIKTSQGLGYNCEYMAYEGIKHSSPWQPALNKGKPVRMPSSVTIVFNYLIDSMPYIDLAANVQKNK